MGPPDLELVRGISAGWLADDYERVFAAFHRDQVDLFLDRERALRVSA